MIRRVRRASIDLNRARGACEIQDDLVRAVARVPEGVSELDENDTLAAH